MKRCPDYPACGHVDCSAPDANDPAADPADGEGTYEVHFAGGAVRVLEAPTRMDAVLTASKRYDAERKAADKEAKHVPVLKVARVPAPLTTP